MSETDVHTEHCCVQHGCKYGFLGTMHAGLKRCTVMTGEKKQTHPCEFCDEEMPELQGWALIINEMYNLGNVRGFEEAARDIAAALQDLRNTEDDL